MKILLLASYSAKYFLSLPGILAQIRRKPRSVTNTYALDDLAPVVSKEQNQVYSDALNWALSNDNIRNIAITGPYGSGKSSFIRTFREQYPKKYKYLNISLASFKDDELPEAKKTQEKAPTKNASGEQKTHEETTEENIVQGKKNQAQQLIELSILQQMFYKVHEREIPDSRFKRIRHLTGWHIFGLITIIGCFAIGILGLVLPQPLYKISYYSDYFIVRPNKQIFFSLLLTAPGLWFLLAHLIRFFNHSGFRKISITSGEIEINPKSETSILNKYFDEIIYFFQATRYNLVVIEDLDRFNDPEIFTNLRELNSMLNQSGQLKGQKIVFLYAIRDEIFNDDKTRTKFFDFIIPIVPVISWSNSLVKLTEKLSDPALDLKISEQFIAGVTQHIDDMRALKNIFNEFMLYQATLKVTSARHEKLLAIIIYKNIYPKDFALLHKQQGCVPQIFEQKEPVKKALLAKKENEIKMTSERKLAAMEILAQSQSELRSTYVLEFLKTVGRAQHYKFGKEIYDSWDFIEENNFELIRNNNSINTYSNQGSVYKEYNFKKISATVDPSMSYEERKKALDDRIALKQSGFDTILRKLTAEKEEIETAKLTTLLKQSTDMEPALKKIIGDKILLGYLIREGFIDESHTELISHFYPGKISRTDMVFLGHVNDRVNLDFDHRLEKIDSLISMISPQDFATPATLNIQLIDHLLANPIVYSKQLNLAILQLQRYSERSKAFIDIYILGKKENQKNLITLLTENWESGWSFIMRDRLQDDIDIYLRSFIRHCDASRLKSLDDRGDLSWYIIKRNDFLSLMPKAETEAVKTLIETLSIKFESLVVAEDNDLFSYIVDNGNFVLNTTMCALALNYKRDPNEEEYLVPTLTNMLASGNLKLITHIEANLEQFAMNVLLDPLQWEENQDSYHQILNEISEGASEIYISQVDFKIENIRKIHSKSVWELLFEHSKVAPNWSNISSYYLDQGEIIDSKLLAYLNNTKNAKALGAKALDVKVWSVRDKIAAMTGRLIQTNEINDDSYAELIKGFTFGNLQERDLSVLSEKKIRLLVPYKKLSLSLHNLDQLRHRFPSIAIDLMLKHKKQFLSKQAEYSLTANERFSLLDGNTLSDEQKFRLIKAIEPETELDRGSLVEKITSIINQGKYGSISQALIKALIRFGKNTEAKVKLLEHYMSGMKTELFTELLRNIGGKYAEVVNHKNPIFDQNSINEKLVIHFEKHGLITSKKIDPERRKIRVYTSNKKK